jgi:hypothetical protein
MQVGGECLLATSSSDEISILIHNSTVWWHGEPGRSYSCLAFIRCGWSQSGPNLQARLYKRCLLQPSHTSSVEAPWSGNSRCTTIAPATLHPISDRLISTGLRPQLLTTLFCIIIGRDACRTLLVRSGIEEFSLHIPGSEVRTSSFFLKPGSVCEIFE